MRRASHPVSYLVGSPSQQGEENSATRTGDSDEARELLMNYIEGKGSGFAKVMCVWALGRQNAREMIPRLEAFLKSGRDEQTGFGGNIMDPRMGTLFPDSVKWSIRQLLQQQWGRYITPPPAG